MRFLRDTKTSPQNYDLILTSDLGYVGSGLLYALLDDKGIDIRVRAVCTVCWLLPPVG